LSDASRWSPADTASTARRFPKRWPRQARTWLSPRAHSIPAKRWRASLRGRGFEASAETYDQANEDSILSLRDRMATRFDRFKF
jgi:hypothetical protein